MTGSIIWGWGHGRARGKRIRAEHGRWLAKNLSNVVLPVNADISSDILIHFVDEFHAHGSRQALAASGYWAPQVWRTPSMMRWAFASEIYPSRQRRS
jgi:hypothetical protein